MKRQNAKSRIAAIIALASAMLLPALPASAQDETGGASTADKNKTFSFVYIAQDDETMPVQTIKRYLQTAWNRAFADGFNPTIFYFSRGLDDPIVVKVNLDEGDNKEAFEETLLGAIDEQNTFSVDSEKDKARIMRLLQENDFLDENGMLLYKETNFDFHVGQDFWATGSNESLIAALFFELDIKRYIADDIHFNVYCPKTLRYNVNAPFGALNPDDCRRYVNFAKEY